jgi:hypothetical protein
MKSKRKIPKKEAEIKIEQGFKKDVMEKEERPWEEMEEEVWEDRGGWRGWLSACSVNFLGRKEEVRN